MTEYEELQLVLEIMKKHDLPVSPILEYSIKEKMDKYSSNNNTTISRDIITEDRHKSIGDYVLELTNMSVGVSKGRKLPHKAIVLLSLIDMIQEGIIRENKVKLDDITSNKFKETWEKYLPNIKTPSVWIPFWYLKSEPFWHFKALGVDNILDTLLMFGGHPSIGQMRPVIDYAYLDDDLYNLLNNPHNRRLFKQILLESYILK